MTASNNSNNVYIFGKKKPGKEFKLKPGAMTIKEALQIVSKYTKK